MSISHHLIVLAWLVTSANAQGLPLATPPLGPPPGGDPRLEALPSSPQHYGDVTAYGNGRQMRMRFPPRINGQNQSDGDRHADLYILFDETTGLPVTGQPPIAEAAPIGSALNVPDIDARKFSASWQIHVVTVASNYSPFSPTERIDSVADVMQSSLVDRIYETNIHINAPVVPANSTIGPGFHAITPVWYDGQIILVMPCGIDDGGFSPQVLFQFEDQTGAILPSAASPHLVLSRTPSDSFFSPLWEVWTVTVPNGFAVNTLDSSVAIRASGLPMRAAHIRLNAPVTAVETTTQSGVFLNLPPEDPLAILRNDYSQGVGRFNPRDFRINVPEGTSIQFNRNANGAPISRRFDPTPLLKQRVFLITDIIRPQAAFPLQSGGTAGTPTRSDQGLDFPRVADERGSFVPIILQQPFATTDPNSFPTVSNPISSGEIIRVSQLDLDTGMLNQQPQLPPAIEQNIQDFIANGLMDPEWAIGVKPYHERLALIGRALHELVWTPDQGASAPDTTNCVACHTMPVTGAAARGALTSQMLGGASGTMLLERANAGSLWGSGSAQLLVEQKRSRGEMTAGAHGSLGMRNDMRAFVNMATAVHLGLLSTEIISEALNVPLQQAALLDPDNDGVINEMTAGEITAHTAFLLSLPVPRETNRKNLLTAMSVSAGTVQRGRLVFRRPLSSGGPGCADCHTPFHMLTSTTLFLDNPETDARVQIEVDHHRADSYDVIEGLADHVGQAGLRIWGDMQLHKMGSLIRGPSTQTDDIRKTAELWDVGSVYPLLRDGAANGDLYTAIAAHEGVSRSEVLIQRGTQTSIGPQLFQETVTLTNQSSQPIPASVAEPIRLVLDGRMLPATSTATNVSLSGPHGQGREGSVWLIESPIPAMSSITVDLEFQSPTPVTFGLVVQDHDGYSEAVASARAFLALPTRSQDAIIGFLRAQLIDGRIAEDGASSPPYDKKR